VKDGLSFMARTIIKANHLSKYYGDAQAIQDVSFTIHEGEIVGLLGLNGAGKSTILKILGCFLLPSAGSAEVGGFTVEQQADLVRRIIGYLPDTPPLYNEMTILSYLRYVARLKDVPSREVEEQVAKSLERCNLQDVRDARLRELSHGFRQRVGIAQAIVHDPKVLILDEPINGLDPLQIAEMRDLILSFRGTHTVILSSHILSEVTRTCDRILIIDKGRVVAEGSEKDLERKFAEQALVQCHVSGLSDAGLAAVRQVPGVRDINVSQGSENITELMIRVDGDVRAQLARSIVESGGDLLGLTRKEAGLERLFVQLIQASGRSKHQPGSKDL
jgi:ABC-2 type transport system ATP-binding protein